MSTESRTPRLEVQTTELGAFAYLIFEGEIDRSFMVKFENDIRTVTSRAANTRGSDRVIVDLRLVTFIDGGAIYLVEAIHRAASEQGKMVVILLPEDYRMARFEGLLDLAQVDSPLLYTTTEEWATSIRPPAPETTE